MSRSFDDYDELEFGLADEVAILKALRPVLTRLAKAKAARELLEEFKDVFVGFGMYPKKRQYQLFVGFRADDTGKYFSLDDVVAEAIEHSGEDISDDFKRDVYLRGLAKKLRVLAGRVESAANEP